MLHLACVKDKAFTPVAVNGAVRINEVFSTGDPDWIELYNPGATAVNLTGYVIYDASTVDDKLTLNGLTISPGGFLVLLCDDTGGGVHTNFRLASEGETVWLEDTHGAIIDLTVFPALSPGTSFGRKPDGSGDLAVLPRPTAGASNVPVNIPPVITGVTRTPPFPSPADSVVISATITDESHVAQAILSYDVNGGALQTAAMAPDGLNRYSGVIPPAADMQMIQYYITAQDDSGAVSVKPDDAPAMTYSYISSLSAYTPPHLFINEFLSSNATTNTDPDFGEFGDWIEIYNAESVAVDMSGMYLTDDLSTPKKWPVPSGVLIPSKGFVIFWADDRNTLQNAPHTNFRLSKNNEAIGLYDRDSVNNLPLDTLTYGAQETGISTGRSPDGNTAFRAFTAPTPGSANGSGP